MTHRFSVRTLLFVLGSVLAVFLFGVQTASAQVLNGSFENGTDPGAFTNLPAGNTNIDDWTIGSGSIDYIGTYWQAADGDRSIDLNGTEAGSVNQVLPTVVGATYDVTFMMSGNPDGGPALKELAVTSTTTTAQNYSYNTGVAGNTRPNMLWEARAYSFVAEATTTTLTFTSLIGGAFGPALDAITIVETLPPPPPPPPPPTNGGCSGGSSSSGNVSIVNGISISVNQSGCISNTTSSRASTGGNSAGGSTGGNGGRGGDVRTRASGGGTNTANGNNGGATAGNGGGGGAGGAGGYVSSGGATATSNTTNILNRVRIRLNFGGLPLPI